MTFDTTGALIRNSPSAGSNRLLSVLAEASKGEGLDTLAVGFVLGLGSPISIAIALVLATGILGGILSLDNISRGSNLLVEDGCCGVEYLLGI
jgi:hypothetical protein